MELTGEWTVAAAQGRVFDALRDLEVLRRTVPGCRSLDRLADEHYEIELALKIGPLKANFACGVEVYDVERPAGCSLRWRADGGKVGSANGSAHLALASDEEALTTIAYHLAGETSGELAELDDEVVTGKIRRLVGEFFSRLAMELAPEADAVSQSAELQGDRGTTASNDTLPAGPPPRAAVVLARFPEPRPASPLAPPGAGPPQKPRDRDEEGASTVRRIARPALAPLPEPGQPVAVPATSKVTAEPLQRSIRYAERPPSLAKPDDDAKPGLRRWVLTAVGVLIIIGLLADSF